MSRRISILVRFLFSLFLLDCMHMLMIDTIAFQGIVGLDADNVDIAGGAFFGDACKEKHVDECRFGMAFGTSGTGKAVFGGLDKALFSGHLVNTHLVKGMYNEWVIPGAVALNGTVVEKNISYTFDTGSTLR